VEYALEVRLRERPGRLLSPKGRPGRSDAPRWRRAEGLRFPLGRALPRCAT